MKPRELRHKVMIPARVRVGPTWSDAAILNLSSRGLLLHLPGVPSRGSYVEIRRGRHMIIARVIWTSGARAGLQSQDPIPVATLISQPDAAPARRADTGAVFQERRATPRTEQAQQKSRELGRSLEFVWLVMMGGLAASFLYGTVGHALAQPLQQVSAVLLTSQ